MDAWTGIRTVWTKKRGKSYGMHDVLWIYRSGQDALNHSEWWQSWHSPLCSSFVAEHRRYWLILHFKTRLILGYLSSLLTTGATMPLWSRLTAKYPANTITPKLGSLFSHLFTCLEGIAMTLTRTGLVTLGVDLEVKLQKDFFSTTSLMWVARSVRGVIFV